MESRAHLSPQVLHWRGNCTGAVNRPRGAVEAAKEPVADRVELAPSETREVTADYGVMPLKKVAPGAVAECRRLRGRVYDIGEKHGGEDALGFVHIPLSASPDARDHQLGSWNPASHVAGPTDVEPLVVPSGEDERRHPDRRQYVANIHFDVQEAAS